MASKEIEFKIKVIDESGKVLEQTTQSIGKAEDAIRKLNEEAKNVAYGSEEWKKLTDSAKDIQGQVDKATAKTEGLGATLSKVKGPIGGVVEGFQGMGQAAKAFIANPIGAVIAAIGVIFAAVTKAIKNSEAAMDSITKIMSIFGGIVRPIFEFIENVAVASLDALASGLQYVADLFGGTASEAGKLADAMDEQEDIEKDLAVTRAQTNKQLAESKEILSDSNATLDQRQAALKKVQAAENAQSKQEVANKRRLLELAQQELKLNGASEEAIQKIRDAKVALAQVEQDAAAKQRQFNKQQKALDKEAEAAEDAKLKAAQERAKEYAANRKAAADKIRALDQANLLASIKDEEERDKKSAQLAKENALREMKDMKLTKEERAKLLAEIEEKYQLDVTKITNDYQKKRDDKAAEDAKKAEADAKALAEFLADTETEQQELRIQKERDAAAELLKIYKDDEVKKAEITAQSEANIQKIRDEATIKQKEQRRADLEALIADESASFEARRNALDTASQEIEARTDLTEKQKTEILRKYVEQRQAIDLAELQGKVDIANAALGLAAQVGGFLSEVAGENKKLQIAGLVIEKAAAIGGIIANTAMANAKAVAAFPVTFGQPWVGINTASAAISIATTIAQSAKAISDINSADTEVETPPAAASAGSKFANGGLLTGPTHENGGILTPMGELEGGEFVVNRASTASFLPLLESINSMGVGQNMSQGNLSSQAENNSMGGAPIIKTYVVASEMSSQQEADKRISDLARL